MLKLLDIQRMSGEDGPGLRTTAFFKGCPLSCLWCHNPESIPFTNQVLWHGSRCMGCQTCVRACPQNGISFAQNAVNIQRETCAGCFSCCDRCPAGALEAKGQDMTPKALCEELCKDRAYFNADGGVTLSGGEALMQEDCVELLRLLKAAGVQTAVDTCGFLPDGRLDRALPYCDVLLFDLKIADSKQHKAFTGVENEKILQALQTAGEWASQGGRLWIRTPIIPDATDSAENIAAIGELVKSIQNAERWELCAFNNLCANKYHSLGRTWGYEGMALIKKESMEKLLAVAKRSGACSDIRATGALRQV